MNDEFESGPRLPFSGARTRILGSGAAFPACRDPSGERVSRIETRPLLEHLTPELTPERRAHMLEHLDEALGIRTRAWAHWVTGPFAEDEEDSATLGLAAARAAITSAGISPGDLGAIVLATSTPPKWTSPVSARIAGLLEAPCPFFDIRSGCASGLYSIALGCTFAAASGRPVLIVGSDTFSKTVPPTERLLPLSTGDGAGALVIGPAEGDVGLIGARFGGAGSMHDAVSVHAALPPRALDPAAWFMNGNPERFSKGAERALKAAMRDATSLSAERPRVHIVQSAQASVCRRASAAGGQVELLWLETLAEHGNLGAASVPVALHEARAQGAIKPGDLVAIAGVGGGMSWGGLLWREA